MEIECGWMFVVCMFMKIPYNQHDDAFYIGFFQIHIRLYNDITMKQMFHIIIIIKLKSC